MQNLTGEGGAQSNSVTKPQKSAILFFALRNWAVLDFTYKQDHAVFVFPYLAYEIYHNIPKAGGGEMGACRWQTTKFQLCKKEKCWGVTGDKTTNSY